MENKLGKAGVRGPLSFLAIVFAGLFATISWCGIAGLVLTFVRPTIGSERLYRLYKLTNLGMPLSGLGLALTGALIWLLIANQPALKEAFEDSFRAHQNWIKLPGIVGFSLFMIFFFGTQGVDHHGYSWELTGKGGRSTMTDFQAIPQLWTDIRWHAVGIFLAGSVVAFLCTCLYLAAGGPQNSRRSVDRTAEV